jgi:ubiquinone/menaquinone biosynthesis C-methylase UbiE
MVFINRLKRYLSPPRNGKEKEAAEAYDLWEDNYDLQPDNLMLHLDAVIFTDLIHEINLHGRSVVDLGCGTGRHWELILDRDPGELVGYDVSAGMLSQLKKKFPHADTQLATDNSLSGISDASVDVMISTLTLAHIENMEEVFATWERVLKPGADLVLTDYHPALLGAGGKRDFSKDGEKVIIKNFVHPVRKVRQLGAQHGMKTLTFMERFVDESVRHFYSKQNAVAIYEKFRGLPLIYGMHMKRS